jgi:integrase
MAAACRVEPVLSEAARQAAVVLERYAPVSMSPAVAALAREVVARAAPVTPARAKAWLFAAGKLAAFGERVGLELSPEVLLREAVIERLILQGCGGVSPATRRTLRTNLRALARSLERYPEPAAVPLARERAKQPYSLTEIDGYLRLADAQSTHARRLRASALVCLGAGAGVIAGELRHVRGTDVVERSGGVLVKVAGARSRAVPVAVFLSS